MDEQHSVVRSWIYRSRGYLFSALAVFVIWMGLAMNDTKPFEVNYAIHYEGIDTARFVMLQYDSTVTVRVYSNGFKAFGRSIRKQESIQINLSNLLHDTYVAQNNTLPKLRIQISTLDIIDSIHNQTNVGKETKVDAINANLSIVLSERHSKSFTPTLDSVDFQFDGIHGLNGNINMSPKEVLLYGSEESLNKINAIRAVKQVVGPIDHSGHYRIRLADSWKQYPDLRISQPYVSVNIPVARYIERSFSVPIELQTEHNVQEVHLYPTHAKVSIWISESEYSSVQAEDFHVSAVWSQDSDSYLQLVVDQFPANARIKSVSPPQVQFTLIQ